MSRRVTLAALAVFLLFGVVFFNKSFFQGQVPFPGDLLIGNYNPYKYYSYLGYAPGSYPNKAQNIDVIEQLYPWKNYSIEKLKEGELPLWNPYNFSGTPHLAAIQSGTFYPFNVLFLIFPFVLAWSIYIIIQPVLAGFFTYLFLKELKLSFKPSVFGGLTFAFSSYLVVWMQYGNIVHALIWMPLALWLLLKNIRQPSILKSLLISLILAISVFAGHLQVTLYTYLLTFAFSIFIIIKDFRSEYLSKIGQVLGIYFLSVMLSSIQIFPSVQMLINSSRTAYSYEEMMNLLIPGYHSISMFFPDFFGNPVSRNYWLEGTYIERVTYFGIIPLFFALFAIIKKRNAYIWFFLITFLVTVLIIFDNFITRFLYSIYIPPVINASVPTRMTFLLGFSGSILAAYGYYYLETTKRLKQFFVSVFIFFFLIASAFGLVVLGNSSWLDNISITIRNIVVPSAVLIAAILATFIYLVRNNKYLKKYSEIVKKGFFIFILLLTTVELFFFFDKFSPFSPKETVYPETSVTEFIRENQGIHRAWGYGTANMAENIHTSEKIYSTDGYDPFYINRYGEFLSTTDNGKIDKEIESANAKLEPGFGVNNLKNNNYRQKAINLLGIKYVIHEKAESDVHGSTFDENIYDLVWSENNLQVYENKNVLPRAFLVSNYLVINNKEKIINTFYSPEFNPSSSVILEEDPKIEQTDNLESSVEITEYSGNKVSISITTNNKSLLFLSDAYYPEWKAYVNGEKKKIYKANYAFRAVVVPEGDSKVIFKYEPTYFKIGMVVSLISFIAILITFSTIMIKRRK